MKYVVSAMLVLLALAAVPNVLTARERSREKRTMALMRDIATKWEERWPERQRYELADVSSLPQIDGWGSPLELHGDGNEYSIRSYGSDRRRDATILPGSHTDYATDIVFSNGTFIAHPEGL